MWREHMVACAATRTTPSLLVISGPGLHDASWLGRGTDATVTAPWKLLVGDVVERDPGALLEPVRRRRGDREDAALAHRAVGSALRWSNDV